MSTNQPKWKLIDNLGDVSPLLYGGYFVYMDETGVYPPEAEYLYVSENGEKPYAELYRFILEPCTFIDGVLSDNPYHPQQAVWFADRLSDLAAFEGMTELELLNLFTSSNTIDRAMAWRCVGEYFGFVELDQYSLAFDNLFRLGRYLKKYRPQVRVSK